MRLPLVAVLVLAPLPAAAQHAHSAVAPAASAVLLPGMGSLHFPITTASPRAQKFFDQGMTLVYGFNHDEAARSFREAARLDPRAAMPHWGLALAIGPNYNDTAVSEERAKATWEAIEKAKSLAGGASEREQAFIGALEKRFSPDPKADWPKLWAGYSEAMGRLFERFPDDADAGTLYAESLMILKPWQLWSRDGKPADGTEKLVSVLEAVLKQHPDHVGANHLYIHSIEASQNPERALAAAKRLETMVPGGGHLVHMPGHIYMRVGDHEGAARINETAALADRNYMQASGVRKGMYPAMYYSHNLHFIAVGYSESGSYVKALAGARQLARNASASIAEMPMVEGFLPVPMFVMLRNHKFAAVLAEKKPDPAHLADTSFHHYGRALAYLHGNDRKRADEERGLFDETRKRIAGDVPFGLNTAAAVTNVGALVLEARFAEADGDGKRALDAWGRAIAAQDALNYDEPPPWYYPVRESLGGALLRQDKPKEAEKVFREDLDRNPRSPRSLFGLIESLRAQDRASEAALLEPSFRKAWKGPAGALRVVDL